MDDMIKDPKIDVLVVTQRGADQLAFLQEIARRSKEITKVPFPSRPAVPKGGKPHIITKPTD